MSAFPPCRWSRQLLDVAEEFLDGSLGGELDIKPIAFALRLHGAGPVLPRAGRKRRPWLQVRVPLGLIDFHGVVVGNSSHSASARNACAVLM